MSGPTPHARKSSVAVSSERIEQVARAFHFAYEDYARLEGWTTQEASRVPFEDLPESNRRTMLATVAYLFDTGVIA